MKSYFLIADTIVFVDNLWTFQFLFAVVEDGIAEVVEINTIYLRHDWLRMTEGKFSPNKMLTQKL